MQSPELMFLMVKQLEGIGCHEAASVLRREISEKHLMPQRVDWMGRKHDQTFEDMDRDHPHISADYLSKLCAALPQLVDRMSAPAVSGVVSLLANGRQSLLRSHVVLAPHSLALIQRCLAVRGVSPHITDSPNFVHFVTGRELSGRTNLSALTTQLYKGQKMHRRYMGHLAQIFCVMFDRSGDCILTGADDSLVKIWSANDGRLLATLRGHSDHITDFSVNYENTLLATCSSDKQIRIWNLKTTAPVTILSGHTAMISSVRFCPLILKDDSRYLVSTGYDGTVCFWKWNIRTGEFDSQPLKFNERLKAGWHILSSSFSSGGTMLAVGSTDHYIRVYHVDAPSGPTKILEMEAHSDQVDSLQFSNRSLRFVSGSKDGTAHIWFYEKQTWKNIPLRMSERLAHEPVIDEAELKKIKVNMVGWNCDDTYVMTSASDHSLRVWDSQTGKLIHSLCEHKDDAFVIEAHPFDSRLVFTGGHDGYIIVWDIVRGVMVNKFHNLIEGQGVGAIYDAKWSRNGQTITTSDSHGHMAIIGFGDKKRHERVPEQVFFHTDYRPLVRDINNYVIDEQTQCPPHQMPPPFLVDIDGNPHSPEYQRLVPGRENSKDDQLVPHVQVNNERGVAEILQPVNDAAAAAQENPTIDHMIQLLINERHNEAGEQQGNQIRQDHDYVGVNNVSNDRGPSAAPAGDRRRQSSSDNNAARRRDGEAVEGVRQPGANWQSRDGTLTTFWMRRTVVKPLPQSEVTVLYKQIKQLSQMERHFYSQEKKKRPLPVLIAVKDINSKEKLTRRKMRINQQRSGIATFRRLTSRRHVGIVDDENVEDLLSDSSNEHRLSGAESWSESSSSSPSESDEDSDEENNFDESSHKKGPRQKSSPNQTTWQHQCRELLEELFKRPDSRPFRSAVDPIMYPDYNTVVDTPMDLGTVRETLFAGEYENIREFRKDMDLIFANSKTYNTDKRSSIYTMTLNLASLCKERLDEITRHHKRAAPAKRTSPKTSRAKRPQVNKPASSKKKKRKMRNKKIASSSDLSEPGPSGLCLASSAASEEAGPSSSGLSSRRRTAAPKLTNGARKRPHDSDDTDEECDVLAKELHDESDATEIEENANSGYDTDATEIAENESSRDSFRSQSSVEPPSKQKKAAIRPKAAKKLKKESHSDVSDDEDDASFTTRTPSRSSTSTTTSRASTMSEGYEPGRKRVSYVGKGKYPAKLGSRTRNGGVPRVSYAAHDDDTDGSDHDYNGRRQRNGRQFSSRGRLIKFKGQPRDAGQVS